ncbi:MAG: septum formation initiator family protein [Arachidicoccus sp.]|nr:septum formation initiator family protein [Arachidicoccus sp.]
MNIFLKTFSYLKNKYVIAILVFAFLMFFYDKNDIFIQMDRKKDLANLEKSREFYQSEITNTQQELDALQENSEVLEKYAREHLYMKRDNEDIFIVDSATSEVK